MRQDIKIAQRVVKKGRLRDGIPAPFAGKFPTRVHWVVQFRYGNKTVQYIGKPSRRQMLQLEALVHNPQTITVHFYECDRTHLIASFSAVTNQLQNYRVNTSTKWKVYHPWQDATFGWEWMLKRWHIKKIRIDEKRIQTVYSPRERLDKELHVETYKRFMRNQWALYGK